MGMVKFHYSRAFLKFKNYDLYYKLTLMLSGRLSYMGKA